MYFRERRSLRRSPFSYARWTPSILSSMLTQSYSLSSFNPNIWGKSLWDSCWIEKFKFMREGIFYLLSMRLSKLNEVLLGSTKLNWLNCFLVVSSFPVSGKSFTADGFDSPFLLGLMGVSMQSSPSFPLIFRLTVMSKSLYHNNLTPYLL